MGLIVKIKENTLRIELPLRQQPKVSGSGKNMVVASTKGPKHAGIQYKDVDLYVIANAFITNPAYKPQDTRGFTEKSAPKNEEGRTKKTFKGRS